MKPKHGDVTSSQSCSCTSCTYRSESDRPSFRKLVAQGSKIDKLYLGKFIPLRERQLIGKLVRTRAVYDDLRTQLFSGSHLNITEKANLQPRTTRKGKELSDVTVSNAILELVNLIDKGEALGSRRLSDCCSCCSCGSTIPLQEHEGRVHRHGRAHISSRSSMVSAHRTKDERRKGRHALRKAKHISSDPCTCTSKLSGFLKRESKAFIKKLRDKEPAQTMEPQLTFDDYLIRSRGKLEGMGETIRNSLTKIKLSKTRLANKIRTGTKNSLEVFKSKRKTIKHQEDLTNDDENVFNAIKDSLTKYHEDIEKKELLKEWECDFECDPKECKPDECFRIITKKRLHKSKNNSDNKELHQKEITKMSSGFQVSNQDEQEEKTASKNLSEDRKENINNKKLNGNNDDITTNVEIDKAKHNAVTVDTQKKNAKIQDKCLCENIGFQTQPTAKSVKSNTILQEKKSTGSVKSFKNVPLVAESTHKTPKSISKVSPKSIKTQREAKPEKLSEEVPHTPLIEPKERSPVRIGSSFSFSVEFYKEKPLKDHDQEKRHKVLDSQQRRPDRSSNTSQSLKKTAQRGLALRRCFCTLKLKHNKNKLNNNKNHKTSLVTSKSLQTMTQSPVLSNHKCEPGACVPGKCDPIECKEIIRKRGLHYSSMTKNAPYKSRSTPSLASKSVYTGESNRIEGYKTTRKVDNQPTQQRYHTKDKFINETKPPKQTVRLSSNFSFKIELFKDERSTNSSLKVSKNKISKRYRNIAVNSETTPLITSSGKSKYSLAKHNLRRCFCTLKLAKPENIAKRKQYYSRGTFTSRQSIAKVAKSKFEVFNKAIERKEQKSNVKYALLPYECEPGICIAAKCNPYKCLELINLRRIKTHARLSGTDQYKSKSTYSTPRTTAMKSVHVLPYSSKQKYGKVASKRKPVPRVIKSMPETRNKPAVSIRSSFSFNIAFYKEKLPSIHLSHKTAPKMIEHQGVAVKNRQVVSPGQAKKIDKKALEFGMKRCFCTLKLHKMPRNNHKKALVTTSTETDIIKKQLYPSLEMATKGTKMKVHHNNINLQHLDSNECEPNFCKPGQCDPIQCLKRIKVREKVTSKEFGTITSNLRRRSTSSATKTKKGKDAFNQSWQKAKQIKRYSYTPSTNYSRVSAMHNSRHAVQIRSNLSFNVEFSKNQPSKIYSEGGRIMSLKHKEDYRNKSKKQGVTQTLKIKKNTKSSGIRPMLKRCFCTLRLQNDRTIKNSITVMPVLIQNRTFSTLYKGTLNKPTNVLSRESVTKRSYSSSFFSILSSTCSESSHFTSYTNSKSYQQSRTINLSSVLSSESMVTKYQSTLIGLNHYLKSSFYAMNIHVKEKLKKKHRLKPYECEPGVCTPGLCNPVECQKLIMKRVVKSASTSASTETRSQSISSGTPHSKHKKHQYNKHLALDPKVENEQQGLMYETLPRAHKKGIRIGSSLSFNIEYSKDRTTAQQAFRDNKSKKLQGSSTNISSKQNEIKKDLQILRHNRASQSATAVQHKASYIAPNVKRCFCTLKIQKKGRQNKALDLKAKEKIRHDVVKTANVGQNTKKYKQYSRSDLDPNECEPNVCIPDKCDPHECLERIEKRKRRKNTKTLGTVMEPNKINTSSMASIQNGISKGEGAHVTYKPRKSVKAPIGKNYNVPSREVVRFGSNISFDVEFFKDKSYPDELLRSTTRNHKQSISQNDKDVKKTKQDSKSFRHHNSQVKLPEQHDKFTKSDSLIKRCFCTANLHNQDESSKMNTSKTRNAFLTKCLCVLKSVVKPAAKPKNTKLSKKKAPGKANSQKNESSVFVQTKNIKETRQDRVNRTIDLDPNECEPGVCIPGKCDPLICIERIKKRKANKMSSTDTSNARSTATFFQTPKSSKYATATQNTQHKTLKNKPQVKRLANTRKYSKPLEKSVIRIGSTLSFNVEFYKENHPSFENIQKRIKEIKRQKAAGTKASSQTSSTKGLDKSVLLHNRESQVDNAKKINKSSDVGPMLKRCFCTLALRKQKNNKKETKRRIEKDKNDKSPKIEMSTKGTETPTKMFKNPAIHKNQPYKLEPYECEPGVCVPGKCDPHECEKLIKKRQRRNLGTAMVKRTSKSVTTTSFRNKHKDSYVQGLNRRKKLKSIRQHASIKKNPMSSKDGARHTLRIGSNISFDVEFSKSKTSDGDNFKTSNPAKMRTVNTSQAGSPYYQKTQNKKDVHDAFSQVLAKKVRSTVTDVGPLLKRCFCTLTLKTVKMPTQNKIVQKPIPKKINDTKPTLPRVARKNVNTDKPNNTVKALDPNECEPGTCVPGKCNPRQCLQRIRQRMQSQMSNTQAIKGKKVSTMTSKPENTSASVNTTTEIHRREIRREAGDNLRSEKRRSSQSPSNRNKDIVRIGSNFSFNIELFKDNTMASGLSTTNKIPNKNVKETSQSLSRKQTKLVDRQLQSRNNKTQSIKSKCLCLKESKASRVGPLMKKCFCTLKLQKVGKLQQKKTASINKIKNNSATANITTKIENKRISRNARIGSNKKHRVLKPYECEPNTCIPGKCDPLKCYERIKLRNLYDIGTDTLKPSTKYAGSLTDGKSHLKKIQTENMLGSKPIDDLKKKKHKRISNAAANPNRQSYRLESRFNLDIEYGNSNKNNGTPSNHKENKVRIRPAKTTSKASIGRSPPGNHRSLQVVQETAGSGISPLLKRCFCTLTLHKTETNKIAYNSAKGSLTTVPTKNKHTNTKKQKGIKISNIVNEPCERGTLCDTEQLCSKGQCNWRECNEKKKCKYRTIRARSRQCPKSSITISPTGKSKNIQLEDRKIARVVEQPRFPFIDPKNWQGVKIGTKISFNFELYKENAILYEHDNKSTRKSGDIGDDSDELQEPNYIPEKKMSIAGKALKRCLCRIENSIKSVKDPKAMKNSTQKSHGDRKMQPQKLKPEKKVSIAGKVLKKCFCMKPTTPKNVVTVGRIDNSKTMSPFKPTHYCVYQMNTHDHVYPDDTVETIDSKIYKYLDLKAKKKPQVDVAKNYNQDNHCHIISPKGDRAMDHNHLSKDIKTILSYKPKKYNKYGSNTLFSHSGIAKGAKHYCCYRTCQKQDSNSKELPSTAKSKYFRLTAKEKEIVIRQSAASVLKKLLCMKLFPRDTNNNYTLHNSIPEVVKKSKSDRRPIKVSVNQPKKSKSLKYTTMPLKKKECIKRQKDSYSRLQSGDAKSKQTLSDKTLVCHYQGFITEGQIVVVKCPGPAKNKNTSKAIFNKQNASKENHKALDTPKPGHVGFLFQCARTFSECKDKFIRAHIPHTANSEYRKSFCISRNKNKHPNGSLYYVKYNNQHKEHALLGNGNDAIRQSFKTSSRNQGCSVKESPVKPDDKNNIKIPCKCFASHIHKSKTKIKFKIIPKSKRNKLQTNNYRTQRNNNSIDKVKVGKKYHGDSLLTKSDINATKLGRVVDNFMRSTTKKLEECSARDSNEINRDLNHPSVFGCKASLRRKPWFVSRFCPWLCKHWLNILKVWKQFTDVLLFLLAVVVWSPCIFVVEGCRAATCRTCKS